jgi:2-methylcitrate dehydratase PrpD
LDTEKVGITRTLAEYLTGLEYEDIPADAVGLLKIFTLEAVGHMVNAHAQPVSKMLVGYARELGAAPQASVIGSDLKTSVAEAAYVNGSLAHADELESYGTLPGTGLIPPIVAGLAAGEYRRSSGRDFIAAVVAGIEMQGRLGMAGIGACDRGFMGISLVGVGTAAVTAGRLFGLDVRQMQNALGTALPLGNGSTRGCGSMAHVHEAGVPSRTGVFAAQLASRGFTSCEDYLDGANSWGLQYAGDTGKRPYNEAKLTEGLGDRLFLQFCGVSPKEYGSCGLTHQTIYGTIEIMRENGVGPDDIASIELIVPPWADRIASYRDPESGEQAKWPPRNRRTSFSRSFRHSSSMRPGFCFVFAPGARRTSDSPTRTALRKSTRSAAMASSGAAARPWSRAVFAAWMRARSASAAWPGQIASGYDGAASSRSRRRCCVHSWCCAPGIAS